MQDQLTEWDVPDLEPPERLPGRCDSEFAQEIPFTIRVVESSDHGAPLSSRRPPANIESWSRRTGTRGTRNGRDPREISFNIEIVESDQNAGELAPSRPPDRGGHNHRLVVSLTILDLPNDLFVGEVFGYLEPSDLRRVSSVNRRFRELATCDVLWMEFRDKLFSGPQQVTENVYATYIAYLRKVARVSDLFGWIPCVYCVFFVLFGLIAIFSCGGTVVLTVLLGFRFSNQDVLGLGASIALTILGSAFYVAVCGLVGGIEMWSRTVSLVAYSRIKTEQVLVGDSVIHRFPHFEGGTPEYGLNPGQYFRLVQYVVWILSLFPCLILSALVAIVLRVWMPFFTVYRCTLVCFVLAVLLHELILYVLAVRALSKMNREFRLLLFGGGGLTTNCIMKLCCLGFLIPLSLCVDGLFPVQYLPLSLIPFGFLAGGTLLLIYPAIASGLCWGQLCGGCREGSKANWIICGGSSCFAIWICCNCVFLVLVIVRFAASLSFPVFWSLLPLWGTVGIFVFAFLALAATGYGVMMRQVRARWKCNQSSRETRITDVDSDSFEVMDSQ